MLRKASIPSLRRRIDRIDDQILRLLNRRARVVLDVAAHKARTNSRVYAPERERSVLSRLVGQNGGPLPARLVRAIFREIISASRSLEQRLTIAYLGPEATFCHLAARQQFGAAASYRSATTIAEVFHEVESERAHLWVVPVENSTRAGRAHARPPDRVAAAHLPRSRCRCGTVSPPGRRDARRKKVVAHPQALAQCRVAADHLPGVPTEPEAATPARPSVPARARRRRVAAGPRRVYRLTVLARADQSRAT
jgi:chorismate mutase/prephenate dehydratase